jgi:SecD/SecF fusion protein
MSKILVTLSFAVILTACTFNKEELISTTPVKLEFMETYFPSEITSNWLEAVIVARAKKKEQVLNDSIAANSPLSEQSKSPSLELMVQPMGDFSLGAVRKEDRDKVDSILTIKEVKEQFPEDLQFRWSMYPEKSMVSSEEEVYILYAVRKPSSPREAMTGKYIKQATVGYDDQMGQVTIDIALNKKGTERWAQMTSDNVNRIIAICVDGAVISAPRVMNAITQGNTQISGSFNVQQAEELAGGINAVRKK